MTAEDLRFKEIEHKYLLDERFDIQRFRDVVATLRPARTFSIPPMTSSAALPGLLPLRRIVVSALRDCRQT